MHDTTFYLSELRWLVSEQMPFEVVGRAILLALVLVVVGVGLCVFGAKMARGVVVLALGAVGGWAGTEFGRTGGFPVIPVALGAAVIFAVIGHLTFRLWVGVLAGIVLSSVVVGAFGIQRVVPFVPEFRQQTVGSIGTNPDSTAPQPAGGGSLEGFPPTPLGAWGAQFRAYVTERDPSLALNGRLLAQGVLVLGTFLGVLLVRLMLILSTSVLGTLCLVTGLVTLMSQFLPNVYRSLEANPTVMGMGMGGFLVTSLIVQALLTRGASAAAEKKSR